MVEQGLWGAGINALAALCAGGLNSFPAETLFINGECRTDRNAFIAFNTFPLVDAYLKGICLVGNGLNRAERAEEPALGPPFCQNGQYNDGADEKGDKDDRLHKDFDGRDFHKFSDRLERTQP